MRVGMVDGAGKFIPRDQMPPALRGENQPGAGDMVQSEYRPRTGAEDAKVIAVDFDGTLCEDRWPDIGEPHPELIEELKWRQSIGCQLILWTCRVGDALAEAVGWCKAFGLRFDAVNENLPELRERFGNDCRKVYADLYIDDRAQVARGGRLVT